MCLLTLTAPEATPDYTRLYYASYQNPDGFGFAMPADGELLVVRGMDIDLVLDEYQEAVKAYPDVPSIFHLRLATHGVTDTSNCHPFYVGNDKHTVMAHNGILPVNVPKHDRRSDTRIYAEDYLPQYGLRPFTTRKARRKIRNFMGSYNKIAMITVNPDVEQNWLILNHEAGHWREGTWYSNTSYEYTPNRWKYRGWTFGTRAWDDEDYELTGESTGSVVDGEIIVELCQVCGDSLSEEDVSFYGCCNTCNSCTMCWESYHDCMCYKQDSHSTPLAITAGGEW